MSSNASRSPGLLLAIAAQLLFAFVFLGFFLFDISSIPTRPIGYTVRELVEISAVLALVLGVGVNVVVIRRTLRRASEAEQSLLVARGAFERLAEAEFERWTLSRAEREVAILAIKGLSNSEIAEMTGKSEGTIKSQSAAVFRKAGVQGRVGLVTHFMDELIGDPLLRENRMS